MQTQDKRETQQIKEPTEKKKGSAVLTPETTPSFGIGLILALIFLLGNLFVAAIYFHVINP